jgi:hypothetical protein
VAAVADRRSEKITGKFVSHFAAQTTSSSSHVRNLPAQMCRFVTRDAISFRREVTVLADCYSRSAQRPKLLMA